jgi:hypothetical protein
VRQRDREGRLLQASSSEGSRVAALDANGMVWVVEVDEGSEVPAA